MRGVVVDITEVLGKANRPLVDTWVWSNSDTRMEIRGVPASMCGLRIDGVAVEATNAEGVVRTVIAQKTNGAWIVTIPAGHVLRYGVAIDGFVVRILSGLVSMVVAQGSFCIKRSGAEVLPGTAGDSYVRRGEDVYKYASTDDNGQKHYMLERLAYDAEMEGWGLTWSGDYVLVDGQFVEAK